MLDLAIRDATDNHKSLDDVFRLMNAEYAQQGKFYNDSEGIRAAVEEVAGKELSRISSAAMSPARTKFPITISSASPACR